MVTTLSEPRIRMHALPKVWLYIRGSWVRVFATGLLQKIWDLQGQMNWEKRAKRRGLRQGEGKGCRRNSSLQSLEAALTFLLSSFMQPTCFASQGIPQ